MFKLLPATFLFRGIFPILSVVCCLLLSFQVAARGQGPIAVWPASERYILVADKSYPGIVLVDLDMGTTIERLEIQGKQPKGIASCAQCDFVFVSGANGDFWVLRLADTVEKLLAKNGTLRLAEAKVEDMPISTKDGPLKDGRMVLVSDDGKTGFIASSYDDSVFRVEFGATPKATRFFHRPQSKPFGVNWDKNGGLLVSMHKRFVVRFSLSGERLATYDIKAADCPGAHTLKPNLRAAVDDPFDESSVLILTSNPKSYDAALWRLSVDRYGRQSCVNAAGTIGRDSGWVDAVGEDIVFSRPHYFTMRPNAVPPQAIITDIDNRALRLLNLKTLESTTVMYNRDIRLNNLPPEGLTSAVSCASLGWKNSTPAKMPDGASSCARPAKAGALALSLQEARAHCHAEGARLCEPVELRSSGVSGSGTAWTRVECASCWQRLAKGVCDAQIKTFKSPDMVHSDQAFLQSWNSGHSLEVVESATGGPATLCKPLDDNLKASAPCCADIELESTAATNLEPERVSTKAGAQ